MKKLILLSAFAVLMAHAVHAQAVVVPPAAPAAPVASCGGVGFPGCAATGSIIMPAMALAFAGWVMYADANGIAFPLCNRFGLKCYDDDGHVIGQ